MDLIVWYLIGWNVLVPIVALLGTAFFIWGRGIRQNCDSDLMAGPGILAAISIVLLSIESEGGTLLSSLIFALFGVVTIGLSFLARPGSKLPRRALILTGLTIAVIAGGYGWLMRCGPAGRVIIGRLDSLLH
jgi:hypothetical protein